MPLLNDNLRWTHDGNLAQITQLSDRHNSGLTSNYCRHHELCTRMTVSEEEELKINNNLNAKEHNDGVIETRA